MKNKTIVEELKKFPSDSEVKLNLKLTKYALTEICYHSGTWNDKGFTLESQTNWRSSEVESENFDLEELIELLSEKELNDMSSNDFGNLSLGEARDGSIDIDEIEWDEPLTEEEEDELVRMDLFNDSDINDSDLQFDEGTIWFMEIEVNGEKFSIEN